MERCAWAGWVVVVVVASGCGSQLQTGDPATPGGSGGSPGAGGGGGMISLPPPPTDSVEIRTEGGTLRGFKQDRARVFLGIPYAAPPVGELRWKPPQRAAPWDGIRDASQTGAMCPQGVGLNAGKGSEDCLYLNVWVPSPPPAQAMPVMVWIHGGGYVYGSGEEPYYAGKNLAENRDVIVVTLNYRLGPFGFLGHPELAAEDSAHPSSGNYGIEDQIAALQWVQRNVAAFGGDSARVTIFGESAGGYSACVHYVSPPSRGLFHAVISESGLCTNDSFERTRAQAESDGAKAFSQAGCSSVACMRGKSTADILKLVEDPPLPGGCLFQDNLALTWSPNIDGDVVVARARERFASGAGGAVPLLLGTTRDEGALFLSPLMAHPVYGEQGYEAALARRFGQANVPAILQRYPASDYLTADDALAAVAGDAFFVCPNRRAARAATAAGAPVYLYSFQRQLLSLIASYGVVHGSDLPFVFGTDEGFPLGGVDTEGWKLSSDMQGYWAQFAAGGDPNDAQQLQWPRYDASSDEHMVLDLPLATGSGLRRAQCDFWDTL